MQKQPPFRITNRILELLQNISLELGVLTGAKLNFAPVMLRKKNQIKTIQSSLAIEGNTLSMDQVTSIIEGRKVLAPKKDITEVNNAVRVYSNLGSFNPLTINSLLKAHELLMKDLVPDNGSWRNSGVGIFKENKIAHLAPPASRVPLLMNNLFEFIKQNNDIPWLIKACIFHYELEFIHPFSDGNGRMGRLWQQLLLTKANSIFEYIPVETLIKDNQSSYYEALSECDKEGESTGFIEFMGEQILESLKLYTQNTKTYVNTPEQRLIFFQAQLKCDWFSRKDYLLIHKDISTATASRDLNFGIKQGLLIYKGNKNQTYYSFALPVME
jgi:Fic family protein